MVLTSYSFGMAAPVLSGRALDLLVIEMVDDDRRRVERPLHAVVVGHIVQPERGGVGFEFLVQHAPIAAVSLYINFLIQRQQVRVFFTDIIQYYRLVVAPQVEVF